MSKSQVFFGTYKFGYEYLYVKNKPL